MRKILPDDPLLLMSVVNTKLRDAYASLDALCEDLNEDRAALEAKLAEIGFFYDQKRNQFTVGKIGRSGPAVLPAWPATAFKTAVVCRATRLGSVFMQRQTS